MKIIVTKEDLDRSKPPEDGWHLGKINKITDEASKKKDSVNTYVEFVILRSAPGVIDSTNRYFRALFNSKGNQASWLDLFAAVMDKPRKELEEQIETGQIELDTEFLVGKQVWCEVKPDIVDGKMYKKPVNFAPDSNPPF